METKYEKDIFTAKKGNATTKVTLSLEDNLCVKDGKKEDSLLSIHAAFSRFTINILENQEGLKTAVKANIPVESVPYITTKIKNAVRIADEMRMRGEAPAVTNSSGNTTENAAEPKIFSIAEFKGMTPSEVLRKNPANKEKLEKHIPILKENAAKYPANNKLIEAIESAIANMGKEGQNTAETAPVRAGILDCYTSEKKYFREQKDGFNRCYQIRIEYNFSMNIPFCITISNFWAKLQSKEGGQTVILLSTMKDAVTKSYRLNEEMMLDFCSKLENDLELFNHLYYGEMRRITDERLRAKREQYSQN